MPTLTHITKTRYCCPFITTLHGQPMFKSTSRFDSPSPPPFSASPSPLAHTKQTRNQARGRGVASMGSVQDDACDTVLILGLSYDRSPPPKHHQPKKEPRGDQTEPSLTLALSDEAFLKKIAMRETASDEQSAGSSFSTVKEEIEVERQRNADDDDEGGVRKKLRLTKEQSALLEDRFKEHSTLNPKQKMALAKQLNLRPRQVEVWFQNRRARTKLKQTEVDCEILKRCCETLTDENRRLHRELQELKAIKLAPLYMQIPSTASITMCPSCERISADGSSKTQTAHLYPQFTRAPSAAC